MTSSKVLVFTTTFYKNNEEGELRKNLAKQFFRKGVECGYAIFTVDAGTDEGNFIDELNSLGVHAYPETRHGLGESRRESLDHALKYAKSNNIPYLLWSEAEKVDLVKNISTRYYGLVERMDETKADMIVPARGRYDPLGSYPQHQKLSETFGNQRHSDYGYFDMDGDDIDTFFGPKIWKRELSPYFQVFGEPEVAHELAEMRLEKFQEKYGIELDLKIDDCERAKAEFDLKSSDHMMHMPACLMILKGLKVLSRRIDYTHPKEQTEFEERNERVYNQKRLMQLNALDEQFELVRRIYENNILEDKLEKMLSK